MGVGVRVGVGLAVWSMSGPNTGVLDVANPSEEQIRQITELLLAVDDMELRGRIKYKLVDLGERSLGALAAYAPKGPVEAHVALELIQRIKPQAVIVNAERLFDHANFEVRSAALLAVAPHYQDERTIRLWVRALSDADARIRRDAATSLGNTPKAYRPIVVQGLLQLRNDPDRAVWARAVEILTGLTQKDYAAQFNLSAAFGRATEWYRIHIGTGERRVQDLYCI